MLGGSSGYRLDAEAFGVPEAPMPTNQIADYVGCSVEVALERLFKLEDEIISKLRGRQRVGSG